MNKFFVFVSFLLIGLLVNAQKPKDLKLNAPDKTGGKPIMEALAVRHSDREFDAKELSLQDISDLLWAANGINRPEGKRTAPSAMNKQDVEIYVLMKDGVYLYDALSHSLNGIVSGDHRSLINPRAQSTSATPPVGLVLVSDLSKFGSNVGDRAFQMGALDAGIVSQNINLFCAGKGFSTVPRMSMDNEGLKKLLNLKDAQIPMLNNPVGYPKKN
ncbi:MAG: SagB/ThcOx family dehydrogenase [Massilibacteroides sp.]|nr:SagB/ThcOx family dehydrogenase [Massilibacteroides sp.]MDD3062131.1 SagB/ThcOx family dehydrogenase [Massilibacteroides sp.]MDD4114707.1 SagB/ThcOx family dehydrogenase [Massilibacteroides sp.]MDD4660308.1 SagB/ThcOx family dehydrogenase [Massilibacteroides sp.]